ncbi:hypothetical protein HG530_001191 [Fusarium avenaceum]|nr:hypothetical protein HG530_001191 [Fusarium avenaceum]
MGSLNSQVQDSGLSQPRFCDETQRFIFKRFPSLLIEVKSMVLTRNRIKAHSHLRELLRDEFDKFSSSGLDSLYRSELGAVQAFVVEQMRREESPLSGSSSVRGSFETGPGFGDFALLFDPG